MKDNLLFQSGCTCDTCLELRVKEYEKAYQEWQDGTRDIVFDTYYYRRGDGCCDEYGTNVYVNGFELPCNGEDPEGVLVTMLAFLKQNDVNFEDRYDDDHLDDWDDYEYDYDDWNDYEYDYDD